MTAEAMVLSYRRCSSPKQKRGDTSRRQAAAAESYCERHGLKLNKDFVLEDMGVSAYSGANLSRGPLHKLVTLCQSGELPEGTILLVEAFDRLTRLKLGDAISLFMSLLRGGLTIITLTDERRWTEASLDNPLEFILSVTTLSRGHEESETKSMRVRAAYDKNRKHESNVAFGSAPGWLSRENKFSPWVVDESKAHVVRRVFELSVTGLGSKAIAAIANAEGWTVPTRHARTGPRWHAQMPGQLLRNRAVLGEHEYRIRTHEAKAQHWAGLATGQVVSGFYPRIVSDDLWYRSRASISTRGVARRRDTHGYNIWAGLLFCGYCGAPLHRKGETRGQSRASVVCSDRLAGITECKSFSASNIDELLLNRVLNQAPAVFGTPRGDQLLTDIAALEVQERQAKEQVTRIEEFIVKVGGDTDSLVVKYRSLKDSLLEIQAKLTGLREAQVLTPADYVLDDKFLSESLAHLYSDSLESRIVRAELHVKLARLISHIWVWGYDAAVIEWEAEGWRTVIPLRHKALASRLNPKARYHKPVPPRVVPEGGPVYALLSAEPYEFEPPVPQRRNQVTSKIC